MTLHSLSYAAFQSTPSVWRETVHHIQHLEDAPISIHSLRVEGDSPADAAAVKMRISIHSLRVEGDLVIRVVQDAKIISIHSLRVEGDH